MKLIRSIDKQFVPASHEDPKNPGVLKKVLFGRADFDDGHVQMLNWSLLGKGKSFARHYHETLQEIFIILEGSVEITVGDSTEALQAGDAVIVEAGEVHSMINTGESDAYYLVFGISKSESGKTVNV